MNKIIGNFLASQNNGSFPLDCETLDYLQTNRAMAEMLGAIAGDKIILSGCVASGNTRSAGYVFLKTTDYPQGEVLYFEGGAGTSLCVSKEDKPVVANATPYPRAYTERKLIAGQGAETYAWADFVPLTDKNNRQLRQELSALQTTVNNLSAVPVGCIMMWGSDTAPEGWHLCDGATLYRADYPQLFAAIGTQFGGDETPHSPVFLLPDMQGYFVAGKGANGYNTLGDTGGANSVVLTKQQMPSHNHEYGILTPNDDIGNPDGATDTFEGDNDSRRYWRGQKTQILRTSGATGGGQAHENRPPFIVMNYIIKIK